MKKNHNDPTYYVGYRYINRQGYPAEIVAYRHNKSIDIKFDDCDTILTTKGTYIRDGQPLHPVHGKPQVGDKFPCKDGDTVEIVEYVSSTKVLCKWLSDGAEKWTEMSTLKQGVNKHPNNWKFNQGDVVKTKNNGDVRVLEYRSAVDILIRFDTSEEKSVTAHDLRLGFVRPDGKYTSRVGQRFVTNSGWNGEVVEWKTAHKVKVKWQDGSESWTSWSDINNGGIKPLFQPSVAGVGYVGDGNYLPKSYKLEGTDKSHAEGAIYQYWQRMLTRCYNEDEQAKPSGRAYIGCSVSKDWHNFQNFAAWAVKTHGCAEVDFEENIWHLDKDILSTGNRVYSEAACLFVPNEVNTFFSGSEIGNTGYLGVNYIKPATEGAKEGYIARCHSNGVREYLGYYNTAKEAYNAYKLAKIAAALQLAYKWKGKVDDRVIEALLDFEQRLPLL